MIKSSFADIGCNNAKDNEVLAAFGKLVETCTTDGVLDFNTISTQPFMPYWKYIILYRYLPDEEDFVVTMFGVHVAELHCEDWTGKKISQLGIGEEATKEMIKLNRAAMLDGKIIYASGAVNFDKDDYRTWHQMKVPFKHQGGANGVLVCMVSSWKNDLSQGA